MIPSIYKKIFLVGLMVFQWSCSSDKSDGGESKLSQENPSLVMSKTSGFYPQIDGPQIVFEGESISIRLIDTQNKVESIEWTIDGIPQSQASNQLQIQFDAQIVENHLVEAHVQFSGGQNRVLPHVVSVLGYRDGWSCLNQTKIDSPHVVYEDEQIRAELLVPSCIQNIIRGARWSIEGVTSLSSVKRIEFFRTLPKGSYIIKAQIIANEGNEVLFSLIKHVVVIENSKINHICPLEGEEKIISESEEVRTVSCGLNGSKDETWKKTQKQVCQMNSQGVLDWVTLNPVEVKTSESQCLGQSCQIFVGESSITLSNGESKNNVVTGTVKENLTCQFNEQGYYQEKEILKSFLCTNGEVTVLNETTGQVTSEKLCPNYSWTPSEEWTTCTQDCGGEQARLFKCQDQYNTISESNRCGVESPIETRICDGNPKAVEQEVVVKSTEEALSSTVCAKNQLGVIIQKRDVTTTSYMACSNHEIKKVDEVVEYGAWIQENLCRDYVAKRCSHDSLSIAQAKARYQWMNKCQDSLPKIKEFFVENEEFGIKDKSGRSFDSSRPLYVTFMQTLNGKEVVWKAPVNVKDACQMPETAYIAAICVSSCATPDQFILVQDHKSKKPVYKTFIEALEQDTKSVMTLKSTQSLPKNGLAAMEVKQWVTELIDTEHTIVEISLKSGAKIKLTPNHPMVIPDGSLKLVGDLKIGDELVTPKGDLDPIVDLKSITHFGKVYNVFPASASPQHNIVVINGYLSGSALFQNGLADQLNRRVFRNSLTKGLK